MSKSYEWVVRIEVHPDLVADGLDLTDPDVLYNALCRAFPYARMGWWGVEVVESPDADAVAREQGYASAADRAGRTANYVKID